MNHVSLVGRFARDPHFADGETPKVYFTLAVKRWGNDDGVDFIDLVSFGPQALNVVTHKHKGDLVAVDGRLHHNSFETGELVYEGAHVDLVPGLMNELAEHLNADSSVPAMVRAGMAHLNLVMIHPFRDGNGRMARCLQTLILAREGILAPAFCSIEEYLGRNTRAYYDVLGAVGGGAWKPERDALPWIRFTLTAHLRQARTLLRRINETETLWGELERLTAVHRLRERTIPALFDAAMGFRVRNATYRATAEEEITDATASRDLRQMVAAGLLQPLGESRGRFYTATAELLAVRRSVTAARDPRDDSDPFAS